MIGINGTSNKRLSRAERRALSGPLSAERRATMVDASVPQKGAKKARRMDEGISAIYQRRLVGKCYTREEIAREAGCTDAAIYQIETRALRRLRSTLGDELLRELLAEAAGRNL